jgi:predicted phosphodiesterase
VRYGIYGDIHGNLEALDAVLADMKEQRVETYVCTGDIVGYGANPKECLRIVRDVSHVIIAGNHDHAVAEKLNIDFFNAYAKEAVVWTRRQIDTEERDFLYDLPLVYQDDVYTVVHGTLNYPQMFDYIQTSYDAYLSLELLQTPVCFLGHSHVPITFFQHQSVELLTDSQFIVEGGRKYLVNVGSVGQPRDENPLASYAVFDSTARSVEIRRCEYDIETASRKIIEANLPPILAERLFYGR